MEELLLRFEVGDLRPDAVVGIPKGLLLSRLFPKAFSQVRVRACLGRFPGTPSLGLQPFGDFPAFPSEGTDLAAILFTSGSTGPAKGVLYRHEIFKAQVEHLQALYQFQPGEVDLPGFPLFALFSAAMGVAAFAVAETFFCPIATDWRLSSENNTEFSLR